MLASGNKPESHNYISQDCNRSEPFKSIAFVSISTGEYHFDLETAATVAIDTVEKFTQDYPDAFDEIRFVFLDPVKYPEDGTAIMYQAVLNHFHEGNVNNLIKLAELSP